MWKRVRIAFLDSVEAGFVRCLGYKFWRRLPLKIYLSGETKLLVATSVTRVRLTASTDVECQHVIKRKQKNKYTANAMAAVIKNADLANIGVWRGWAEVLPLMNNVGLQPLVLNIY